MHIPHIPKYTCAPLRTYTPINIHFHTPQGKWHCGARSPANLPINRGFDSHYGFLRGGEDHCTQRLADGGISLVDLWSNHTPAHGRNGTRACEVDTFSATQYGREAVRIVREHDAKTPLFMYLPFQVSHSPYQIPPGFVNASVPKPRLVGSAVLS